MDRNFQFLFFGLTAAWAIVILYLLALAQRNRKIRLELERVKRMVNDREL
jgi:hypothetical protein